MRSAEPVPDAQTDSRRWGTRGTAGATFAGQLGFENVSRRFGRTAAVEDVSFTLKPGEIACLLGPSGCGKTTLLRIAAGIDKPDSGRLLFDGQEMAGPTRFVPPEKRNIGLMFQDFALFSHLSIVDNVAFGLNALPRQEARGIALHALERVGLAAYAANYPHSLSGGEQQRVALARAFGPRPPLLLADEPTGNLDSATGSSILDVLVHLRAESGTTLVLVTHDPAVAALAGRRIHLRDGRIERDEKSS